MYVCIYFYFWLSNGCTAVTALTKPSGYQQCDPIIRLYINTAWWIGNMTSGFKHSSAWMSDPEGISWQPHVPSAFTKNHILSHPLIFPLVHSVPPNHHSQSSTLGCLQKVSWSYYQYFFRPHIFLGSHKHMPCHHPLHPRRPPFLHMPNRKFQHFWALLHYVNLSTVCWWLWQLSLNLKGKGNGFIWT